MMLSTKSEVSVFAAIPVPGTKAGGHQMTPKDAAAGTGRNRGSSAHPGTGGTAGEGWEALQNHLRATQSFLFTGILKPPGSFQTNSSAEGNGSSTAWEVAHNK